MADELHLAAASTSSPAPLCNAISLSVPISYIVFGLFAPHTLASMLAMVPVNTFLQHRYVWNVVSNVVYEPVALFAAINVAVVSLIGRPVEMAMGTQGLVWFLGIVTALSSCFLIVLTPILSAAFDAPFVSAAFGGFFPCTVALSIASWQLHPTGSALWPTSATPIAETTVGFRTSVLPATLLLAAVIVELVAGDGIPGDEDVAAGTAPVGPTILPAFLAFHVAWCYLRFFKGEGDSSDAFAYEGLFPGPLRFFARACANGCSPIGRAFGLKIPLRPAPVLDVPLQVVSSPVAPTNEAGSVADRRRQVALAALAQRLENAKKVEKDSESRERVDF